MKKIHGVNAQSDQVQVEGEAILFESGLWAPLPGDLPEEVALAALDVAGPRPKRQGWFGPGIRC